MPGLHFFKINQFSTSNSQVPSSAVEATSKPGDAVINLPSLLKKRGVTCPLCLKETKSKKSHADYVKKGKVCAELKYEERFFGDKGDLFCEEVPADAGVGASFGKYLAAAMERHGGLDEDSPVLEVATKAHLICIRAISVKRLSE